jgi:hypothetical protein
LNCPIGYSGRIRVAIGNRDSNDDCVNFRNEYGLQEKCYEKYTYIRKIGGLASVLNVQMYCPHGRQSQSASRLVTFCVAGVGVGTEVLAVIVGVLDTTEKYDVKSCIQI